MIETEFHHISAFFQPKISDFRRDERLGGFQSSRLGQLKVNEIFQLAYLNLIQAFTEGDESCIECLIMLASIAADYDIPESPYTQNVAHIIINILTSQSEDVTTHIKLIKAALAVVSNTFAKKSSSELELCLLQYEIVKILHNVFEKFGEKVVNIMLYAVSNIIAKSEEKCKMVLNEFSLASLKKILELEMPRKEYNNRCRALVKNLTLYKYNNIEALEIFNFLAEVKKFSGNWIFEFMGHCLKWFSEEQIENENTYLYEAYQIIMTSNFISDLRGALIYIGFSHGCINEQIIKIAASNDPDISETAIWVISMYIDFKGSDASKACLGCNILALFAQAFEESSYKKQIECGMCLCKMIQHLPLTDILTIISSGLISKLGELLSSSGNRLLSIYIIKTFTGLLMINSCNEIIRSVCRIVEENYVDDIATELADGDDPYLSKIANKFILTFEKVCQ